MVKRSLLALGLKVCGAGLTLMWNVVLARELGPEGFGTFALAFACVTLLGTLARMGLDLVVLGDVARSVRRGDRQALGAVLSSTGVVGIVVGGSLAVGLVLLRDLVSTSLGTPELAGLLLIMAPAIPLIALNWLAGEVLKGLGQAEMGVVTHWVVPAAVFTLSLVSAGEVQLENAGSRLLFAYGVSGLAAVAAVLTMTAPRAAIRGVWSVRSIRGMLSRGRPLLLLAAVNMVLMWTDVLMLGLFEDSATVGVYTAALRLSTVVSFSLVAVSSVVTPQFAVARDLADPRLQVGRVAFRAAGLSAVVAGPLAAGFVIFSQDLLGFFGAGFGAASPALAILLVGQFLHSVSGIGGYALVMVGGERPMGSAVAIAAAVNVALNACLIPVLGMTGAALSTGISTVIMDARVVQALVREVSRR